MVRDAVRMCDRSRGRAALLLAQNGSSKVASAAKYIPLRTTRQKAFSVHTTHSHQPQSDPFPFFVSKVYLDQEAFLPK
jgi:hypothetical protein